MLNILVVLRAWGSQWLHRRISIACDNEAVVHVLNSGKTRDLTLAAIAHNIQLLLATHNIDIVVRHILEKVNIVADLLSRWSTTIQPMAKYQFIPNHVWNILSPNVLEIDWSI